MEHHCLRNTQALGSMSKKSVLVLIAVLYGVIHPSTSAPTGEKCSDDSVSTCVCKIPGGGVVDLNSAASTDGNPR